MALDLHDRPLPQVFSGGMSIDNLSWWFWIKAGIGFTLGVWVTMFFLAAPTAYLWLRINLWYLTLAFRR